MISLTKPSEDTYQINFACDFTFNCHQEFRKVAKEALSHKPAALYVSLRDVKYIDSSALGMLLLAIEEGKAQSTKVSIVNATGYVAEVLQMAMIESLSERIGA